LDGWTEEGRDRLEYIVGDCMCLFSAVVQLYVCLISRLCCLTLVYLRHKACRRRSSDVGEAVSCVRCVSIDVEAPSPLTSQRTTIYVSRCSKVDHHNDSITSWRRVGMSGQSESAVPNVKSVALCGDSLMQELSIGVTSCITSSNHGIVHGGNFLFFGAVPPDVYPRENCIALA